jgi:hypothetical protein
MKPTDANNFSCDSFLEQLDLWLAGELASAQALPMQQHAADCVSCQHEVHLARAIDGVVTALPVPTNSLSQAYTSSSPSSQKAISTKPQAARLRENDGVSPIHRGLLSHLLNLWRQPLVFAPALALLLATLVLFQFKQPTTPATAVVVIDGKAYSQQEIAKAMQDFELALRYLNKYGNYPAQTVHAQLEQTPKPQPATSTEQPAPSI